MAADLNMSNPSENPYAKFYEPSFGTIIGRPMAFNAKCDPNQRVYQDTMLKNNTIVRITPGIYNYNQASLKRADEILEEHSKEMQELKAKGLEPGSYERKVNEINQKYQDKLIKEKVDMRYLTFKPDFPHFLRALQLLINRTSTSLFNRKLNSATGSKSSFLTDILASLDIEQNAAYRGFNMWVEKSTSISESINNSYTSSVFEGLQNKVSRFTRELQAVGMSVGNATNADQQKDVKVDGDFQNQASVLGQLVQKASSAMAGSKIIIPQIWDDSKFTRTYNIAFRFSSPYGDDRSCYVNVILPFLFLLCCALPRQDGPSGMMNPFLLQMDCPGYFSTPMGCVTDMSFVKGGNEQLWNYSGLPMVIEGTMAVSDLYNALSLPLENQQLLSNYGTAAFLNNLVGASLYSTEDPSVLDQLANSIKGGLMSVADPLNQADAKILSIMRWAGLTKQN
jgi:hypothetical protein